MSRAAGKILKKALVTLPLQTAVYGKTLAGALTKAAGIIIIKQHATTVQNANGMIIIFIVRNSTVIVLQLNSVVNNIQAP